MTVAPHTSGAIDQVEAAIRGISHDPHALSRLAVISTLRANGECTWVSEISYQLCQADDNFILEAPVYLNPRQKADLLVNEEVFEVKSTFTAYAVTETEADTRTWLIADVEKMRTVNRCGHQVITIATMAGATYVGYDEKNRGLRDKPARANVYISERDREKALEIYTNYAQAEASGEVKLINLGKGTVPRGMGQVQLDVLLYRVRQP